MTQKNMSIFFALRQQKISVTQLFFCQPECFFPSLKIFLGVIDASPLPLFQNAPLTIMQSNEMYALCQSGSLTVTQDLIIHLQMLSPHPF
jgi:hypothetical protein